jgi:hypothetical protein
MTFLEESASDGEEEIDGDMGLLWVCCHWEGQV